MKETKRPATVLLEKLTEIYIFCMLSVFLLFPGLEGYARLTSHKWILLAVLSGGYMIVSAVLRLELAALKQWNLRSPWQVWKNWSIPQKLIFLFWFWSALSTVFSLAPMQAFWGSARLDGFLSITFYCGSFLQISRWGRPKRWMLWVFGSAISINCVIALIQLAGYNPLSLYPVGMNYYDSGVLYEGQFLGTIGNTNLLSAVLCIAVPAFITAVIRMPEKRRFLLLIPSLLGILVLVKASVAGGWIGVAGSVLLGLPVVVQKKTLRKSLAWIIICLMIIGLLSIYYIGNYADGVLYEAHQLMHGHWDNHYGSGRLFIWQAAAKLVPQRLLLGGGPDTLGIRTKAYFEHYDAAFDMMIRSKIDTAHNEYLNVLVNQGLPAMLLYLAALVFTAVFWVKTSAADSAVAICGSGVLGYCIQAFFGISSPVSTPFFWLLFGLLISYRQRAIQEEHT